MKNIKHVDSEVNIYKFDKEVYRDRRNKGYRGQVSSRGTKEFNYEQRRLHRILKQSEIESLKGEEDERDKLETIKKNT